MSRESKEKLCHKYIGHYTVKCENVLTEEDPEFDTAHKTEVDAPPSG